MKRGELYLHRSQWEPSILHVWEVEGLLRTCVRFAVIGECDADTLAPVKRELTRAAVDAHLRRGDMQRVTAAMVGRRW